MRKLTTLLLIVVGLIFSGGVASASLGPNLILNGDFNQDLDDWTVLNGGVDTSGILDAGNAAWLNVPSLAQLAAFPDSTVGAGSLTQAFQVVDGTTALQVSFDYLFAGMDTSLAISDTSLATLAYQVDGQENDLIYTFWQNISTNDEFGLRGSFSGIIQLGGPLQNIDPNATLTFALFENIAWDGVTNTQLYVDNVNVSAIPLPSALLLFGSGLAGLAFFPRKIVGRHMQRS